MENNQPLELFKTAHDLEKVIKDLINEHREAKKNRLGVMFRVVIPPNSPTIYEEGYQGKDKEGNLYKLVQGVRICDYKFEKSTNLEYVLSDRTCGLSFSRTFSHLKGTQKMLARHANGYNKPGPANVSWWILSKCDMPSGLEFIPDPKDNSHYFLAVTERMHITVLVGKLQRIAYHMSVMKDQMTKV
jgi:hypothetical protein